MGIGFLDNLCFVVGGVFRCTQIVIRQVAPGKALFSRMGGNAPHPVEGRKVKIHLIVCKAQESEVPYLCRRDKFQDGPIILVFIVFGPYLEFAFFFVPVFIDQGHGCLSQRIIRGGQHGIHPGEHLIAGHCHTRRRCGQQTTCNQQHENPLMNPALHRYLLYSSSKTLSNI